MRKVWAVIRREFVERVRRKWFWFSAILGPVFFAAVFLLPALFASSGGTKRIAVVDGENAVFGARVTAALNAGPALRAIRVVAGALTVNPQRRPSAATLADEGGAGTQDAHHAAAIGPALVEAADRVERLLHGIAGELISQHEDADALVGGPVAAHGFLHAGHGI